MGVFWYQMEEKNGKSMKNRPPKSWTSYYIFVAEVLETDDFNPFNSIIRSMTRMPASWKHFHEKQSVGQKFTEFNTTQGSPVQHFKDHTFQETIKRNISSLVFSIDLHQTIRKNILCISLLNIPNETLLIQGNWK